jgi:hypothetical protein
VQAGERLLHDVLGRRRFVDQQQSQAYQAHAVGAVQVLERQRRRFRLRHGESTGVDRA